MSAQPASYRRETREDARLACLRALDQSGTPSNERFDQITCATGRYFNTPVAVITLVQENQVQIKSAWGTTRKCTARQQSYSDLTIKSSRLFVVEDTAADPRFAGHDPDDKRSCLRFFAGAPITIEGRHRIGALCVGDFRPRCFNEKNASRLVQMARLVANEMVRVVAEKDRAARMLKTQGSAV